jgi:hypothetical protein
VAESWDECAKFVLEELKSLNKKYEGIQKELKDLNTNLTSVKIKVAGISAIIAIIISLGIQAIKSNVL